MTISGVNNWKTFQDYAQRYFSDLWGVDLRERSVKVGGSVDWKFDLVSPDAEFIGDAKWLKNVPDPAAKWQAISEYIWLLQKVKASKVFMVFGRDAEVVTRYLARVRPLTEPIEFFFLDGSGHHVL